MFCRELCVLLNSEDIYRTLAHILLKESNLKFVRIMVEHLNMILLTSSELYDMRNRLKDLKDEVNNLISYLTILQCLFLAKLFLILLSI